MLISPATDAEIDAVAALINAAYRGEESRAGWTHEADYVEGPRTTTGDLRRNLAAAPGAVILVAREAEDGPPLACVWLEPKEAGAWYLGLLSVRPGGQDRGLGRAMIAAAEAHVAAEGAQRMRMQVVSIRDTLIAWYGRRGYRLTGERRPFPYGDPAVGRPQRDDLEFVLLEKPL